MRLTARWAHSGRFQSIPPGFFARLLLVVLSLLLAACFQRHKARGGDDLAAETALAVRESTLDAKQRFALRGRIGVSNGKDAGSAQFRWQQTEQDFVFELVVSITSKRFELSGKPGLYRLTDSEGNVRTGFEAETLLLEATGWRVPVRQMRYWIRAMRAPDFSADLSYDVSGRPKELKQAGWTVNYKLWGEQTMLAMPRKIEATRGKDRVRVIIARWDD
jgi:outer membrane lipoprotein LolB